MNKVKLVIWIFIVWLSAIQRHEKLECFVFLALVYFLCSKLWRFLFKERKYERKSKNKYKYQNLNDENKNINIDNKPGLGFDIKDAIIEAKNSVEARKDRIDSYDFREFKGRKNVDWNEVYDYLWFQCRYKGVMMWSEYMNHLIEEGVISEADKRNVFKKANNYIPWKPRPDLEALQEIDRKKTINHEKEFDAFWKSSREHVYKRELKHGLITEEEYDRKVKPIERSLNHLKIFDYEEYLKRKGYV